jgi:acetyl esterase
LLREGGSTLPIHPKIKSFLDSQPLQSPDYVPSIEELRLRNADLTSPIEKRPPIFSTEDKVIEGVATNIPIRIYTPEGNGPFPLFIFFHGGGFVLGNLDTHDVICRRIANFSNHKVISVDYRLAPEHPFPAAPNDCYAAVEWAARYAEDLNGDATRITVGGDSAGGNLAAVVCLMARERQHPFISKQVLLYPVIDYFQIQDPFVYDSYKDYDQYGLPCSRMSEFWRHYMGQTEDKKQPYASPIHADSLSYLPPALILTAEYDILRDEGEGYAERLKEEGSPVIHERIKNVNHGFLNRFDEIEESTMVFRLIADFVNQ